MKKLAIGLAFAVIGATAASAQSVQFGGPGGPGISVDRGMRTERTIIERRDRDDVDRTVVRRRGYGGDERVVVRRSAPECRTIIVRRENRMGDMVTKRIRRCG